VTLTTTACRSCGADVVFVVTTGAHLMPIDAVPVAEGNVVLTGRHVFSVGGARGPEARVELAGQLSLDALVETEAPPRYLPHFATCPEADDWRR
jgi:hypothetical protein